MVKTKKPQLSAKLFSVLEEINAQKQFAHEDVLNILKSALIAAYRKKYKTSEGVDVEISEESQELNIFVEKEVVDNVFLQGMQVHIDEAKRFAPDVKLGDKIRIKEDLEDFGRVAAQTAISVAAQQFKILEQKRIKEEYSSKVGELIHGYILRKRGDTVYLDLGSVEAIMPVKHQIPRERYRLEDKLKVLLHSIEEDKSNMLKVIVSRGGKMFVQKLFEMEVPEIYENAVQIEAVGRVPGIRTKIVVHSSLANVDPVGACVGVKGVRIQSIVRELGNERVDIVKYSSDPQEYIKRAISPAVPVMVKADPATKQALVVVSDKDLSIAIGKEGSNVKIASYVTGYKLDVKNESEFSQEIISPEARKNFEQLFSTDKKQDGEVTPLENLSGLSKRIIRILYENNIKSVEDLLALEEEDLITLEDIGEVTAKKIMQVISENIEFEEDESLEEEPDSKVKEEGLDQEKSVGAH